MPFTRRITKGLRAVGDGLTEPLRGNAIKAKVRRRSVFDAENFALRCSKSAGIEGALGPMNAR